MYVDASQKKGKAARGEATVQKEEVCRHHHQHQEEDNRSSVW